MSLLFKSNEYKFENKKNEPINTHIPYEPKGLFLPGFIK